MSTTVEQQSGKTNDRPVAIVTGASRGIGKGIALRLAKDGFDLVINYHSNTKAAKAAEAEAKALGARCILIEADAGTEEGAAAIVAAAAELPGVLELLVNNAGINRDGLLLRMSAAQFNEVIQTDLNGPFLMIREAAKVMMKKRYGRIINVSSVVGLYGNAGQANYAAAKAGLIGLTKTVAKELAARNITCNAIAPGFITTDMTMALSEDIQASILSQIAMKRFGFADEVAAAVAFLGSREAAYITGQVLEIAGGLAM